MSNRINPDKRNIILRYFTYLRDNKEYLTHEKLFNMAIIRMQKRMMNKRVFGLPYKWALEVTNICNSYCALCPVGEGFISRPKGIMKFTDFKNIIDKYKNYIYFLGIYNWGDPLLHPDIYNMIEYAHNRRIYIEISTNLCALKDTDIPKLVKSGLNSIGISLHGISKESYQSYHRTDSFETVVNKMKMLKEYKSSLGINFPKMTIVFVVNKHNEHEINGLTDFAKKFEADFSLLDASLNIRYVGLDKYMHPLNLDSQEIEKRIQMRLSEWLPQQKEYINKYYLEMLTESNKSCKIKTHTKIFQCRVPWDSVVISWNGDVNFCCGAYKKEEAVGNIFQTGLKEIWNNPAYQNSRFVIREHEKNNFVSVNSQCTYCPGMLL